MRILSHKRRKETSVPVSSIQVPRKSASLPPIHERDQTLQLRKPDFQPQKAAFSSHTPLSFRGLIRFCTVVLVTFLVCENQEMFSYVLDSFPWNLKQCACKSPRVGVTVSISLRSLEASFPSLFPLQFLNLVPVMEKFTRARHLQ